VLFPNGDGAAAVLPKGVVEAVAGVEVVPPNGEGAAPDEGFPKGLDAGAEVPGAVVPNGLGDGAL